MIRCFMSPLVALDNLFVAWCSLAGRRSETSSPALQTLFKRIANSPSKPPPRMSIESGPLTFHYLIDGDVVYLTLVDKAYPKKLAFQYLDELSKEFNSLYGPQIDGIARPYAFIKFDNFIQKTKKLYLDTRTQRNIERLNADIAEVHSIMTRNIQDVLGQGERLDRESDR